MRAAFQGMRVLFIGAAISIAGMPVLFAIAPPANDPPAVVNGATPGEYDLAAYGQIRTAAEAQAALEKALADIIRRGGGVLVVPPAAPSDWKFENQAPSSTRADGSSVTIVDRRFGYERTLVPSNGKLSGLYWASHHLQRDVRQNVNMPFGVHSTQVINTNIAGGTASYIQPCLFAVKAGSDRRVYLPTIRGLYAGMSVNFHGAAPVLRPDRERPDSIARLGQGQATPLRHPRPQAGPPGRVADLQQARGELALAAGELQLRQPVDGAPGRAQPVRPGRRVRGPRDHPQPGQHHVRRGR